MPPLMNVEDMYSAGRRDRCFQSLGLTDGSQMDRRSCYVPRLTWKIIPRCTGALFLADSTYCDSLSSVPMLHPIFLGSLGTRCS